MIFLSNMKKLTQLEHIKYILETRGIVSRNYYLDVPVNKILRLGAIIERLRKQGYEIETLEYEKDCKYKLIRRPDGTVPVKVEYKKFQENGEWKVKRVEVPIWIPLEGSKLP